MMDWSLYATLQSYAQADSYRKTYYMYALLNWTSVANCPRNNNESNQEINLSEFKLFVPKAFQYTMMVILAMSLVEASASDN